MRLIPILLALGMFAVSGLAEDTKPEPYSPELVKKAEAGDAEAQYNLGQCYENGQVGIKDNKDAVKWYTKSAEQGYVKAEYSLSQCCKFGKGVPRDKKEAKKWSDKVLAHASADELWLFSQWRVNPTRQEEENQEIEKRSYELVDEEFEYLKKSAEQGNAKAQLLLSHCYYFGIGFTRDEKEAVKWWTLLAEQGIADAQSNLGGYYFNSHMDVIKDEKEAVRWWTKAAEQGNANAQYNLGLCYYKGAGVTKDEKEAVNWWTKAAKQGDSRAKQELKKLKSK